MKLAAWDLPSLRQAWFGHDREPCSTQRRTRCLFVPGKFDFSRQLVCFAGVPVISSSVSSVVHIMNLKCCITQFHETVGMDTIVSRAWSHIPSCMMHS